MMNSTTKLLVLTVLVLALIPCIFGGHLVHDFYKCQSDWYKAFFKRCKRNTRNGVNSSGQISASISVLVASTSLALYALRRTF